MARSDRQRNVEHILLALFDAHERVVAGIESELEGIEDTDVRGAILDCREEASQKISSTAVDRVQKQMEYQEEFNDP